MNPETPRINSQDETSQIKGLRSFKSFFKNRLERLNSLTQTLFSQDIEGIHFTAREMLGAKFHPVQLGDNVRANLGMQRRESQGINRDPFALDHRGGFLNPLIDNPVLRTAAYKRTVAGDETVKEYLSTHDLKFGEADEISTTKEALAIFSGYAFIRKVGLYATLGVTLAQSIASRNDPDRLNQLDKRISQLADLNEAPAGNVKYFKQKQAMAKLAQERAFEHVRAHDPFDM